MHLLIPGIANQSSGGAGGITLPDAEAYWKLDGNATDSHGSNDLTNNHSVGFTTGKLNQCASFADDYNDSLSITAAPTDYPFTFSCWFKTTNTQRAAMIVFVNGGADFCMLEVTGSGYLAARAFIYSSTSSSTCNDGNWHHGVAVFASATSRQVYLDGVAATASTGNWAFNSSVDTINVGKYGGGKAFDGEIDEAIWFNVALTADNVSDLYGDGTPPSYDDITWT